MKKVVRVQCYFTKEQVTVINSCHIQEGLEDSKRESALWLISCFPLVSRVDCGCRKQAWTAEMFIMLEQCIRERGLQSLQIRSGMTTFNMFDPLTILCLQSKFNILLKIIHCEQRKKNKQIKTFSLVSSWQCKYAMVVSKTQTPASLRAGRFTSKKKHF